MSQKLEFLLALFAGIPEDKRCIFDRVMFFPILEELEEEEDVLVPPTDLVSDKGENFEAFIETIPVIQITKSKVKDVDTDRFDELNKKIEGLTLMLLRKDEEMKKQMLEEVLKIQEEHRKEKESLEENLTTLPGPSFRLWPLLQEQMCYYQEG